MSVGVARAEPVVSSGAPNATAAPAGASGPATLSGQAFVTARGGELVTCAGGEVSIAPVIPDAAMEAATGANPAAGSVRHATCDAEGRFTFQGLTAGEWTVEASIRWDTKAKQGIRHLGGNVMQHVVLRPGDNSVALNDQDLLPPGTQPTRMAQAGSR